MYKRQDGVWERDGKEAKVRAYNSLTQNLARLRHSPAEVRDKWPVNPVDDTRSKLGGGGFSSPSEWVRAVQNGLVCNLDPMTYLDKYVMVAFEAQAMTRQFQHICKPYGVTLWPFSGHASIAYKTALADHIDYLAGKYDKPIVILYFGDYDTAGETIPETAFADVRKWAQSDFTALWCGLTLEQVQRYDIESDGDNGKYQWEALPHNAAYEIITSELNHFCDVRLIERVRAEAEDVAMRARHALRAMG